MKERWQDESCDVSDALRHVIKNVGHSTADQRVSSRSSVPAPSSTNMTRPNRFRIGLPGVLNKHEEKVKPFGSADALWIKNSKTPAIY